LILWKNKMDKQTSEGKVRSDFEDWSGGFPPESEQQIYVYITTAISDEFDDSFVLDALRSWMEAEALA
jgi:hypothetical protein